MNSSIIYVESLVELNSVRAVLKVKYSNIGAGSTRID